MYYLDNIFPLLFHFYRPITSERGRGWLLSLLLRAKPAFYAALTFSVFHQLLFVYKGDSTVENELSLDLDRYLTLATAALRHSLDYLPTTTGVEHLKLGVETLACVLQLMTIEVCFNKSFVNTEPCIHVPLGLQTNQRIQRA